MGLLRKLKKVAKSVIKVAKVTAPIWSSFIPGGSIAANLLGGISGGSQGGGPTGSPASNPLASVTGEAPPSFPLDFRGVPASTLKRRGRAVRATRYGATRRRAALAKQRAYVLRYLKRLQRAS